MGQWDTDNTIKIIESECLTKTKIVYVDKDSNIWHNMLIYVLEKTLIRAKNY